MMKSIYKRGFTLIELLVVIAIIGILASIVLASLNSARDKGSDAAVKGGLAQLRAQAELFYDTPRSYSGFCGNATTTKITDNIKANSVANASVDNNGVSTQTGTQVECHDAASTYVVSAPLKGGGGFMCVDSTGANKPTPTALLSTDTKCP